MFDRVERLEQEACRAVDEESSVVEFAIWEIVGRDRSGAGAGGKGKENDGMEEEIQELEVVKDISWAILEGSFSGIGQQDEEPYGGGISFVCWTNLPLPFLTKARWAQRSC